MRVLAIALVILAPRVLAAQKTCGGTNHYRWKEKVDAPGTNARADTVTVKAMLDDWPHPGIGKKSSDFCIARETDEKKRVVVTGYLWRVKNSDDDGDYHLELTQSATQFSERCVVAEVPDKSWGAGYGRVRDALETIIGGPVANTKDFAEPVHVRVTGVAFWDGWHAGAQKPNAHGRCNAVGIGVWEIHPVTRIARIR